RPFIDCALTHDQATRVADELASRVIAHEVLAPAFRANPIFFDDRIRRRRARHDDSNLSTGGLRWVRYNASILYLVIEVSDKRLVTFWIEGSKRRETKDVLTPGDDKSTG